MQYQEFGVAEPYLRAAVAAVCLYEAVAITTHLVPTVSWIVRRYPVVKPLVLGALAWHFQPIEHGERG